MGTFFETQCSNMSAVNEDISSKCGVQMTFELLKRCDVTEPKTGSKFATLWSDWSPSWKIDMTS